MGVFFLFKQENDVVRKSSVILLSKIVKSNFLYIGVFFFSFKIWESFRIWIHEIQTNKIIASTEK